MLNKIPGVEIDTVEAATFADDFAGKMANNIIDRNAKLQEMASEMEGTMDQINNLKGKMGTELSASATNIQNKAIDMNATRQDRVDHRNDWAKGAGAAVKDAISGFSLDPSSFDNGTIGDIAGNTKDIADNTAEISEEDLKYLIDIAERDTVNRFTTVPLSISIVNENTINGEDDIDGIVDKVTNKMAEKLEKEREDITVEVINARFLKPIDKETIKQSIQKTKRVITIEDGTIINGLGTAVQEIIKEEEQEIRVKNYAYPDKFIEHGTVEELEKIYGMEDWKEVRNMFPKICLK